MKTSVKYHTIADTTVGCFLSGGIDSSLVTALMAQEQQEHVKAFSAQFDFFSEAEFSTILSEFAQIDHTVIDVTEKDALKTLPLLFKTYEEPMTELASIPTYLLSTVARKKGVKVVLSGDGGDELFGGYDHYFKLQRLHERSKGLMHTFDSLKNTKLLPYKARRYLQTLHDAQRPDTAYLYLNRAFKQEEIDDLATFNTNETQLLTAVQNNVNPSIKEFINQVLYLDLKYQVGEYFLMKLDKATMAASIEARVPYINKDLVHFSHQIPSALKYKDAVAKYISRKGAGHILPKEIIERTKKGYGVPLFPWMKSELGDVVKNKLDFNAMLFKHNIFRKEKVFEFMANMRKNEHAANRMWHLFAIENWLDTYKDPLGL